MKITPEDMDRLRKVLMRSAIKHDTPLFPDEERDMDLARLMIDIYDRGYEAGHDDASDQVYEP